MPKTGMTPEEFQQMPEYVQNHFFSTLYDCVKRFKDQPGGQEMLDATIRKMNEKEAVAT